MENIYENLSALVSQSGNCVNLGRTVRAQHPKLYEAVMDVTQFLNGRTKTVAFNERVYCILNGITAVVKNCMGVEARFVNLFRGYSMVEYTKKKSEDSHKKNQEKEERKRIEESSKLTPLQRFVEERKRGRSSHLYASGLTEGEDYVVCPVTGLRLVMIKKTYVERRLGMSMEEFDARFPGTVKTSQRRKNNISDGMSKPDENGVPIYKAAQERAKETLSAVDPESGLTGYQKKGLKSKASHMANVDEFGRNGYQQMTHKRDNVILEDGETASSRGHKKRIKTLERTGSTNSRASKVSKKVLNNVISWLKENKIKYYWDDQEYVVSTVGRGYFYDLTVPSLGVTVEYQSTAYHSYPWSSEEEWGSWKKVFGGESAEETLRSDYEKARVMFRERGFLMWHVWEKTAQSDAELLLCFLKTIYTKS